MSRKGRSWKLAYWSCKKAKLGEYQMLSIQWKFDIGWMQQ